MLGIFLGSFLDFSWSIIGLFFVLVLVFGVLFFFHKKEKIFGIIALIFLGVVFGLFRYSFFDNLIVRNKTICLPSEALAKLGQPNCSGLIIADPDRRDNTTRLVIEINSSGQKVLLITDNFTDYTYGDKIEIAGKLGRPQNFLTTLSSSKTLARQSKTRVFDYQNYLAARGIEQISYYPTIKILARGEGSVIKTSLFVLKNGFLDNLRQVIPEPAATLAGGLILGDRGGLGQKTETEFRQAGLSHIIVLSGYNITIVSEAALFVFSLIVGAWSWLLGIIAIILFVIMTGGEAAAVRSAVMGAIALISRRYGRAYDAGVALMAAGFLMVLWNPRLLVFDLGFQLSFLATLGLIYLSPVVLKIIEYFLSGETLAKLKTRSLVSGLLEIICTTTGAQIAVYPWLLYRAGNASLVGFISNIFVLPAVPLAMFFSFATGIAGFVSYYLSLLISYPTYFSLEYILQSAHWFAGLL